MHIVHITRTLAVGLVLILTATGLWAAAEEEEPGAAAEKEMVLDPATGKMVTAPEYGGTLTMSKSVAFLRPLTRIIPRPGPRTACSMVLWSR